MFTEFINTLLGILNDVFLTSDVFRAVAAVVIALVGGMILKEYKAGKVVNMVMLCLAIFAVVLAVRDFIRFYSPNFQSIGPWLDDSLNRLLGLQVGVLLVYFIAFFLVISAGFAIRRALSK